MRQDEGQYLQDIYLTDYQCGGAGSYGFDRRAHLTETSALLTKENIARLRTCWHPYWDPTKTIRLEKTPGNLIMTRFLQAAFPKAYFIVIRRHPVAVSMASQKWSMSSLHRLFEHWLRCHELFSMDRKYLRHVYELTYEDYVENPAKHHKQIADFIGTRLTSDQMESLSSAHNRKYLSRWSNLLTNSPWKTTICISRRNTSRNLPNIITLKRKGWTRISNRSGPTEKDGYTHWPFVLHRRKC